MHVDSSATSVWLDTMKAILEEGVRVKPRGMSTLELRHHTIRMDISRPIVLSPRRRLSYTFLAAEALWILNGDNRVSTIAPFNPNIAKFSDDGITFFGAYGPKIMSQFWYVVNKLKEDVDTRQAFMTIWRDNPPKTKDVPCTVAIGFSIRDRRLNAHVFMRSSDAWLGLPYDVFNFSMLALRVACAYNNEVRGRTLDLGWLHLTMASSHLYERDFVGAAACVTDGWDGKAERIPVEPMLTGDWNYYVCGMTACRDKGQHEWRIRP
jgi:thymidylate synthase